MVSSRRLVCLSSTFFSCMQEVRHSKTPVGYGSGKGRIRRISMKRAHSQHLHLCQKAAHSKGIKQGRPAARSTGNGGHTKWVAAAGACQTAGQK